MNKLRRRRANFIDPLNFYENHFLVCFANGRQFSHFIMKLSQRVQRTAIERLIQRKQALVRLHELQSQPLRINHWREIHMILIQDPIRLTQHSEIVTQNLKRTSQRASRLRTTSRFCVENRFNSISGRSSSSDLARLLQRQSLQWANNLMSSSCTRLMWRTTSRCAAYTHSRSA